MTFDELNLSKPLLNALNDLGYKTPTPIQEQAYPLVMSGKDIVGLAQTGTGKTFAYLLPLLRQLTFTESKHPRVLIVVPTRELVIQVIAEIEKLTKYMSVRYIGVYGGTNIITQKQLVYDGVDVLVATPGRLFDLNLSGILRLKSIQKLVIDEVDEMLNLGFRPQLIAFMESIPQKRQNLMFSATLTEDVGSIIKDFFYDPIRIEIAPHGTPLEKIAQRVYMIPNQATKINLLELLLNTEQDWTKVLVFVQSKRFADIIHKQLSDKFPNEIGVIHSNRSQNQRLNALKQFQEDTHRVLIATDIIARGLDILDVTHVVSFDTPEAPADYIHRIGRTGRADKEGNSIIFTSEIELAKLTAIEQMMKMKIEVLPLPKELEISTVFTLEEKPLAYDIDYMKRVDTRSSRGAHQEKKDKNKKVNLGGPGKKKDMMGLKSKRGSKKK